MREPNFSILPTLEKYYAESKRALAFEATDEEAFLRWQETLKRKLVELLGGFPDEKCPLDPVVIETTDEEDYVREKIAFQSEEGVSVPAYLLIPKGLSGKAKALLCLHGHGRGKDDVAGIAENAKEYQQCVTPLNYDFARQFVKRGYVVLAPDARCFGERGDVSCTWAFTAGLLMGKILVGLRVWDAIRAVDYLQSREEVDAEQIGCMGLSWGGTHTLYTTICDERIKAACVSGYFDSMKDMLVDAACCPCQYVPHILQYAEFVDLFGLIAPRPLLLECGMRDGLYTFDVVQEEYAKLACIYETAGHRERLDVDYFDGAHMFSGRKAFDWFDRWL